MRQSGTTDCLTDYSTRTATHCHDAQIKPDWQDFSSNTHWAQTWTLRGGAGWPGCCGMSILGDRRKNI